jgi:hypothetical protein
MRGETITIFGVPRKEPRKFGPFMGMFVFLPLMVIAAALSLPFMPLVAWWRKREKRLLAESMTKQNRVMRWSDFVQVAEEKRGTLIVEGDPRKGPHLWWTSEDVRAISPYACSDDLGTLLNRSYKPFHEWCYKRYANPATGSGLIVLGGGRQRLGFALGNEEDERGTGIFKKISTVLITSRGRR